MSLAALVAGAAIAGPALNRATAAGAPSPSGTDLIGTAPPAWTLGDWMGSSPLTLAGLRGKVVLVRWFTDTSCPYCSLTAPALNQLHRDYAARGLVVIGVYHHKRRDALDVAAVRGWAREYGFHFPVAVDRDWRTLRRWWLDGHPRDFTSVSFLIDQQGVIRHIHPGGSLALGTSDFDTLRARIDQLLGG
ncbi:MAG TPA: TlpA disulfide reductase family protein [Polyangia bacterium]|jgi:peroxiredoxin|nr:TlpA disulfide reductase family protein [Polyangia bacterium]